MCLASLINWKSSGASPDPATTLTAMWYHSSMKRLAVAFFASIVMFAGMVGIGNAAPFQSSLSVTQPGPYYPGDEITFTYDLRKTNNERVLILDCVRDQTTVYEQRGAVSGVYTIGGNPDYCVANVYDLVWNGKQKSYDYMVQQVVVFDVQETP